MKQYLKEKAGYSIKCFKNVKKEEAFSVCVWYPRNAKNNIVGTVNGGGGDCYTWLWLKGEPKAWVFPKLLRRRNALGRRGKEGEKGSGPDPQVGRRAGLRNQPDFPRGCPENKSPAPRATLKPEGRARCAPASCPNLGGGGDVSSAGPRLWAPSGHQLRLGPVAPRQFSLGEAPALPAGHGELRRETLTYPALSTPA